MVLTGTLSGYFLRIFSPSVFLFSKGCSSLYWNFILLIEFVWDFSLAANRCDCRMQVVGGECGGYTANLYTSWSCECVRSLRRLGFRFKTARETAINLTLKNTSDVLVVCSFC